MTTVSDLSIEPGDELIALPLFRRVEREHNTHPTRGKQFPITFFVEQKFRHGTRISVPTQCVTGFSGEGIGERATEFFRAEVVQPEGLTFDSPGQRPGSGD